MDIMGSGGSVGAQDRKAGFTLIELMIVVAIIGILAAIAIPRFAEMLERAREGSTKGNIGAIKAAIFIYYGDWEGTYPTELSTSPGAWAAGGRSFSQYMDVLPEVKVTHPWNTAINPSGSGVSYTDNSLAGPTISLISAGATGWLYDRQRGNIWINNNARDSRQVPYSMYGYE